MIKEAVLPGQGSHRTKRAEPRVFPTEWVRGVKFLLVGLTCVRACGPTKVRKINHNNKIKKSANKQKQ